LYTWKFSFVIVLFFKIAFILIELHFLKHIALEIAHYWTTRGMGNFGSESEGVLQKNLKSGVFLQKRIPILKRVMDSKSQCKGKGRREGEGRNFKE